MKAFIIYFFCGLTLFLMACTEKPPEKPISQMTSAELEQIIRTGGKNADKAILHLSDNYMRYGSQDQKVEITLHLASLANDGNEQAKIKLCNPPYWELLGEVAIEHCEEAAENNHPKALATFCTHPDLTTEPERMCTLAAQSGERDAYVEHAKYLLSDGKDGEAYDWLMKAVEDGTPEQRDLAVSLLRGMPDGYAGVFGRASSQKEETAYIAIQTDAPTVPGYRKKGQCFVTWAITPTGHPFLITVDCTHDEIEEAVKYDVHDWRFEPSKNGVTPVFTRKQSTTIYFNQ